MADVQMVSADFSTVDEIAFHIAENLLDNEVPSGYAIMACGLLMGRLLNGAKSTEEEIKFVEDVVGWAGAYHAGGTAKES